MLSNPDAPLHPSLPDEIYRDGTDRETDREGEGKTDGWEKEEQEAERARRKDDDGQCG